MKITHLQNLVNKIDAIYICDDISNFVYSDDLDEDNTNTLPQDIVITKNDVEDILNKIKSCKTLFIYPRPKNNSFISYANLDAKDCKEILNQLTISDYVKNTTSINKKYLGNNLIIFEPKTLLINGNTFEGLTIYIKIDIDESTNTSVVAVSFHETNVEDNKPYER